MLLLKLAVGEGLQGHFGLVMDKRPASIRNVCGSYADASPVSGTSSLIILIEADHGCCGITV